ncbi:hypothetical protein SASPL_126978 [Salvia splendens]|uniref:Uncharacterized protein n=1 Tax=Salvia splendens TaxID=180675 RepID=A0A8X8XLH1_SALSN|nr:hypothetical protein SASPL_126978 [Salvia splendens]
MESFRWVRASDISFVGSARPSSDRIFHHDPFIPARLSNSFDPDSRLSFGSPFFTPRSSDATTNSFEDDVEAEDEKAEAGAQSDLGHKKNNDLRRHAKLREPALAIAEKEKQKCRAAVEKAEAAQRIAELEAQKRINAEMKALKEE